jgi:hypothetical protein
MHADHRQAAPPVHLKKATYTDITQVPASSIYFGLLQKQESFAANSAAFLHVQSTVTLLESHDASQLFTHWLVSTPCCWLSVRHT